MVWYNDAIKQEVFNFLNRIATPELKVMNFRSILKHLIGVNSHWNYLLLLQHEMVFHLQLKYVSSAQRYDDVAVALKRGNLR